MENIYKYLDTADLYLDRLDAKLNTAIETKLPKFKIKETLIKIIDTIKSAITKFFMKIFDKDGLGNLVHVKMFAQYEILFNSTKKVFDSSFLHYNIIEDGEKIITQLSEIDELWVKGMRQLTSIKMSNPEPRNWQKGAMNKAKNMKNTLESILNKISKDIKTANQEDIESVGSTCSKILKLVSDINRKVIQGYSDMLYQNRIDESITITSDNVKPLVI